METRRGASASGSFPEVAARAGRHFCSDSTLAVDTAGVSVINSGSSKTKKTIFTQEEQPLLTGDLESIEEFVECDRCLIVDWRGTEEEVIADASQFFPEGALSYEVTESDSGSIDLRIRFQDREDEISLPAMPQNNFRVLLRLAALFKPDYDIRLFRCTADSDTNGFLIRPTSWWSAYRADYPKQYTDLFQEIGELSRMWDLDKPPGRDSTPSKPWWKFWG